VQARGQGLKVFNDLKVLHVHSLLHAIADRVLPLLIRIVNRVNQEVPPQVAEVTVVPLDTFNWVSCIKGDPIDHVRD
jgi:hypothetical protein